MDRDSEGDAYSRYKFMYGCSTCYSMGPVRFEQTVVEVQNTWFAMRSKQNDWTLTATTMGEGPVIDYKASSGILIPSGLASITRSDIRCCAPI